MLHAWKHEGGTGLKSFTIKLFDATEQQAIEQVTSFVAEDLSGSFGILPGHAPFMTTLNMGLARFRVANAAWNYLAQAGAVLYFSGDTLTLSTRHYLVNTDYMHIQKAFRENLLKEEAELASTKQSLHQLQDEVLKRLWMLGRQERGLGGA